MEAAGLKLAEAKMQKRRLIMETRNMKGRKGGVGNGSVPRRNRRDDRTAGTSSETGGTAPGHQTTTLHEEEIE
ncbi:hypothetical protein QE152_g41340, partial [Popillia japonica]